MNKGLIIPEIKIAAFVLRSVNHTLRQNMLYLLQKKGKMTVTEIYKHLGIDQTVCSGHLAILRKHGIVAVQRDAKMRYYRVVEKRLIEINMYAKALAGSENA